MPSSHMRLPTTVNRDPEWRIIPGCSFPRPFHISAHVLCALWSLTCVARLSQRDSVPGEWRQKKTSVNLCSLRNAKVSLLKKKRNKIIMKAY